LSLHLVGAFLVNERVAGRVQLGVPALVLRILRIRAVADFTALATAPLLRLNFDFLLLRHIGLAADVALLSYLGRLIFNLEGHDGVD
jgi:hypothetical protein